MIVVGLTGGIAAGKSTVSDYFKELHVPVIDTDAISRALTAPGGKGIEALKRVFPARLFPDGALDRRALAKYCFSSEARTKKLNDTLHPLIEEEVNRQKDALAGEAIVVLDVPLLFEAHWDEKCDYTVVVECDRETRILRAAARDGCTREEVEARIARQANDAARREKADFLIDNSGTIEAARAQVDDLLALLKRKGTKET